MSNKTKIFIKLLLTIILLKLCQCQTVDIYCNYNSRSMNDWDNYNDLTLQYCFVYQNPNIMEENLVAKVLRASNGSFAGDLSEIQGFSVEDKKFHYIPNKIGSSFVNLLAITIKKSNLRKITSENLQEFPKVEYLDLSFNAIVELEAHLFQHNPKLNFLCLNNNKIHQIDQNIFVNLADLSYVNLEHNICISTEGKQKSAIKVSINKSFPCQEYVTNLQHLMYNALNEIKIRDERICGLQTCLHQNWSGFQEMSNLSNNQTARFEDSSNYFCFVLKFLDSYEKILHWTCLLLLIVINSIILCKVCSKNGTKNDKLMTGNSHFYEKLETGTGKFSLNSKSEKFNQYYHRQYNKAAIDQGINQAMVMDQKYELSDEYDEIIFNKDDAIHSESQNSEEFYTELDVRTENTKIESEVEESRSELYSKPI